MRFWRGLSIASLLVLRAFGESVPPLPSWRPNERAAFETAGWVAGAILLSGEAVPGEEPEFAAGLLQVEPPKPEEIAEGEKRGTAIVEKFLPEYFGVRPKTLLIDPQNLLSAAEAKQQLSFLNYHASESKLDLFVYLIGGDQEIPSEIRLEEVSERFFAAGRPAVMVYYYLGAPQRSLVYFSPSLLGAISAAEQRRTLESSVARAFEKNKPDEQLEKFLIQMSIRLYWMERMIGGEASANEVAVLAVAPKPSASVKSAKLLQLQQLALKFATPAALLFGAAIVLFGLSRWLRLSGRYRFPEFEVEPRLGGAHAAGVGAVISFASAAVPPASQRNQVPDYLRRA